MMVGNILILFLFKKFLKKNFNSVLQKNLFKNLFNNVKTRQSEKKVY